MNQSYILTGGEIYTLAAVRGVKSIFGLFSADSFPDRSRMPLVLSSLAGKGLVTQAEGRLVLAEDIGRMIDCYAATDRALAIYFADEGTADLCLVCSGERLLYTEGSLYQPDAVKMRFITIDELCEELEESGALDGVPLCPLTSSEPPDDAENGLRRLMTLRLQQSDGAVPEWQVLSGSAGCFMRDHTGTLKYADRAGLTGLIRSLCAGDIPAGEQPQQSENAAAGKETEQ